MVCSLLAKDALIIFLRQPVPSINREASKQSLVYPCGKRGCDNEADGNAVTPKGCGHGHENRRKADLIWANLIAIEDERLHVKRDGREDEDQQQKREDDNRDRFHRGFTI